MAMLNRVLAFEHGISEGRVITVKHDGKEYYFNDIEHADTFAHLQEVLHPKKSLPEVTDYFTGLPA